MNLMDLILVGSALSAAAAGYRLGFLTRIGSWLGIAAGIATGAWLAREVVWLLDEWSTLARLVVVAVVFLGAVSFLASLGQAVGSRVRRSLRWDTARAVDSWAGVLAGTAGVAVLAWLLVPVLAQVPGVVSRQARTSAIANAITEIAPPPPDTMHTVGELVAGADFPQVFRDLRPAPQTGPPPALALPGDVRARVARSTARVTGTACGRVQQGSGFAVAPEIVATNAHVIAGVDRPQVMRPDGRRLPATVVAFDADRDLALLRVVGLGQTPLPLIDGEAGTVGAVFGHPGGQIPVEVSPARITRETTAIGRDIYNAGISRRRVFFLAAELAPGDSGGALVDQGGNVVGVAFAVAPDRPSTAYALTDDELRAVLRTPWDEAAGAGPCVR
jgi:S1-C subfamily serine protease